MLILVGSNGLPPRVSNKQITMMNDDVPQHCIGLQSSWKGVSANGFQEMSSEWIGSTQSTVNELRAIAHRLRELAEYYERLDREERRKKHRD